MNVVALLAAGAVGVGTAGVAGLWRPPTRRLAGRVRPYAAVARSALGHHPEVVLVGDTRRSTEAVLPRLFGPALRATAARLSGAIESRGDDHLARMLRQAAMHGITPERYRVRQLTHAAGFAAGAAVVAAVTLKTPLIVLAAGIAGFVYGASRTRTGLERVIATRAARIRLELYTVNHLLAMQVRTGSGAMQAVQRVVQRGRGVVVEELNDVLTWTRSGMSEADAFRHAAELTPEPSAARTYQLLAAGVERGVDLGGGLLALSSDIRDSRREQMHKDAVRRRAAMLVPTIAILAPIMLLFIAAPLPSIVLGHH
ncbi:MAG TPA: type II secretion system F family protein [Acidimicrobiia bacterium]|nr:type II secretion system F family protein [Acidimicrobiia bacterium]